MQQVMEVGWLVKMCNLVPFKKINCNHYVYC